MDREAAVKLWREIGFTVHGGGASHRLIEAFATAVEAAERECWLNWCNAETARHLKEVDQTGSQRHRGAAEALQKAGRACGPNVAGGKSG